MMLVHIAGVPGAGKSTLGDMIAERFGGDGSVLVEDADTWMHDDDNAAGSELNDIFLQWDGIADPNTRAAAEPAMRERHAARWETLKRAALDALLARALLVGARMVVVVGLLDHFSLDGAWFEMPPDTVRLYLDPPAETVLAQYYGRFEKMQWWAEVVARGYVQSSKEKLAEIDALRALHVDEHSYRPVRSQTKALDEIGRLLLGLGLPGGVSGTVQRTAEEGV